MKTKLAVPRQYNGIADQLLYASALMRRSYRTAIPFLDHGGGDDLVVTGCHDGSIRPLTFEIRGITADSALSHDLKSTVLHVPGECFRADSKIDYFGMCLCIDSASLLGVFSKADCLKLVGSKKMVSDKRPYRGKKDSLPIRIRTTNRLNRIFISDGGTPLDVTDHFLGLGSKWDEYFPLPEARQHASE